MNAKVDDLMVGPVMTTTPSQTAGHVREIMAKHKVSCIPVVGPDQEAVGIVTATDLLRPHQPGTPVSQIMSSQVYTVPRYADVSLAARVMRNQHIHHVVVTHEKRVVGILSSFDLLKLVEEHRFVMKDAPKTGNPVKRQSGGGRWTQMNEGVD